VVGTCQVPHADAESVLEEVVTFLNDGVSRKELPRRESVAVG
jgi:hypothetical protein